VDSLIYTTTIGIDTADGTAFVETARGRVRFPNARAAAKFAAGRLAARYAGEQHVLKSLDADLKRLDAEHLDELPF
jgi:hypothetical protein